MTRYTQIERDWAKRRSGAQIVLGRLFVAVILLLAVVGCAQPLNKSTQGALTGGTLGAGLGAIVGNQSGKAGPGIAVGAAAGALGGALLGNSLDNTDRANAEKERRVIAQRNQIEENRRLIEELRRRGADVRASDRGVVINLPDILFEFDSFRLTREARITLGEISDVLRGVNDRLISIEGHTDSIGTVTYNKRLSQNRAESVKQELAKNGVRSGQMTVRAFGEGSPIATNNTEVGRAHNRRVEVIIEN